MRKIALITGIKGQDGSYLKELFVTNDLKVVSSQMLKSSQNLENLWQVKDKFELLNFSITDYISIFKIIKSKILRKKYNFAVESYFKISFNNIFTKKIIKSLVEIFYGRKKILKVNSLNSRIGRRYAPKCIEILPRVLQQKAYEGYILATNAARSIRKLVDRTYGYLNIDLRYIGEHIHEKRYCRSKKIIEIANKYFRTEEIGLESKTKFNELIKIVTYYEHRIINI